ncbi:hypothetical protein CALVIDRAFT_555263 [Calocera viscosa TUFC12733]|uniref:E3 ubiquitin-protein ligase listerin n=1 Tax=Calocera viscosa (strain TUFC12733) TaxID=1330018 RepID=A0A167LYL8_CALVF|nr:hypothetical protein CALVIDRAFT_555263 [Calocera viscosa TUFC12733]
MAKGGKSSASSATRKKHASKKGGPEPSLPQGPSQKQKGGKKNKKEPKVKVFIPPPKYAPLQPDPLDTLGLVHTLPAELVVVLRRLAKKDATTRGRSLAELGEWISQAGQGNEESLEGLREALPVWYHHLPALLTHPSRQLRLSALQAHHALLLSPLRPQALAYISDTLSEEEQERVLGSWAMAANDFDRAVAVMGRQSWEGAVGWAPPDLSAAELPAPGKGKLLLSRTSLSPALLAFLSKTLHDPLAIFALLHPPTAPPPQAAPPIRGAKHALAKRPEEPPRREGEDLELEEERVGRLRSSALGALAWVLETYPQQADSTLPPGTDALSSPLFWSHLSPLAHPPWLPRDEDGFGHSQIGVRRASWGLLKVLVGKWQAALQATEGTSGVVEVLAPAVLRSAWVEPEAGVRGAMWEPVLSFLTKFPKAWEIEARSRPTVDGEEEDEEEDGDEDEDEEDTETEAPRPAPALASPGSPATPIQSQAYSEFLEFLRTACRGSATTGYPIVLVVLSTIPASILPLSRASLLELFRAFRTVSDERVLSPSDVLGQRAFIASLLESMVYLSGKAWNVTPEQYPEASREGVTYVIAQEFERLASLLLDSPVLLGDTDVARTVARTLVRLAAVDPTLFDTAWVPFTNKFSQSIAPGVAKAFSTIHAAVHGTPCDAPVRAFVLEYGGGMLSSVDWTGTSQDPLDGLLAVLQYFGALLCSDAAFDQTLTAMLHEHLRSLLASFPPKAVASLLVQYLSHTRTEEADDMWGTVLAEIGRRTEGTYVGLGVLQELCAAVNQGILSRPLHPRHGALRELTGALLLPPDTAPHAQADGVLSSLLRCHDRFLDEKTTSSLMRSLGSLFAESLQHSLRNPALDAKLPHLLRTLHSIPASLAARKGVDLMEGILSSLFLAAFILPCGHVDSPVSALAQQVLEGWLVSVPQGQRAEVIEDVRKAVQHCIEDVSVVAKPSEIVNAYRHNVGVLDAASTSLDLVPPALLKNYMGELLPTQFPPHLSAFDPLVPAGSFGPSQATKTGPFDNRGCSVYARLTQALVQSLADGQSVSLSPDAYWAIRHLLTYSTFASDAIAEPGLDNAIFRQHAHNAELQKVAHLIDRIVRHTFSSSVGDLPSTWHQSIIGHIRKAAGSTEDPLAALFMEVYETAVVDKSILGARILQKLMAHIARRSSVADLERWVSLAQSLEDKHPIPAMALILSIKDVLAESPRLNRYQNELASRLSGIPPSRANSQGLQLLRLLIASAPSPDSLGTFIPQQRTIFLIQALQKWMISDEDLDEEIDRRLGELFEVLAPVIIDVPGAHWDLIFEVLESNLEASTGDDIDLPLLHGALRLLGTVRELALASSVLRETWSDHESLAMQLVRQLFLAKLDIDQRSHLQRACRDRVIALAQELPPSLIDDATMQAMYARLSDPSIEVQKTAYHLLHTAVPKVTEQRVIEAAVNTSESSEEEAAVPQPLFTLPSELLSLLLQPLEVVDEDDMVARGTFGRLLGWMVLFDFFIDASPALKSNYVEQLRTGDLLGRSLFPSLIPLLPILRTGRPLTVSVWNVEEFHVELYDASGPEALSVLSAHLFYRALSTIPSLVRTWWMDIKDRQLSSAIASFSSTHFSPLLVSAEFAKLKQPQAEEELAHENLSLKVSTNVSEVTVAYTIDEQQMELGIRLPPDFPLHGVEVRDIKRVGVPVEKWRQWMLQVQQTITSQNGFLLDALVLFKRNVTLYFEGVVECAICYSVISTTDRSLPTKPCKTCKNLFHNSCLYKWFNTSNQSSCPLCRSQF